MESINLNCGIPILSHYLPLGGIIVSDKIINSFNDRALPLDLTYSGHAVSCAAALAVIKVYEEEDLITKAAEMGKYLDSRVAELTQKHPSISDFRNTRLLGCIELVKNRDTKEPMAPWNAKPDQMKVMNQIAAKIKELGMFTFVRWNFIFIAPPLNITKAQMDEGLEIISQAILIADAHCS